MGTHRVHANQSDEGRRAFTRAVLRDLLQLETLARDDAFERSPVRMGCEQEVFLIDGDGRPLNCALEVLDELDATQLSDALQFSDAARFSDAAQAPESTQRLEATQRPEATQFTTELARFNLEVNLPPETLDGSFLQTLRARLTEATRRIEAATLKRGGQVLLTGILPTLSLRDLTLRSMTPSARYEALNREMVAERGEAFRVVISGRDELQVTSRSVMLEAANTSLQLHYQVDPDNWAHAHNLARLISAPLLAVSVNSPVLLGRDLWDETRVALFEGAVDVRRGVAHARRVSGRVNFGESWSAGSFVDLFRDVALRHRVVLTGETTPAHSADLPALALHASTVWEWNRLCYGTGPGGDGRKGERVPHLRVENRILPSGPSLVDEVSNAAFFYGLMSGLMDIAHSVPFRLDFATARQSFVEAARRGHEAELQWLDGRTIRADRLVQDELIDIAKAGLVRVGVAAQEAERALWPVLRRAETGRTGARFVRAALQTREPTWLVQYLAEQQWADLGVAEWPEPRRLTRSDVAPRLDRRVEEVMTRTLYTVRPEDPITLALGVIDFKRVRHVPVENADGQLVGLITPQPALAAPPEALVREVMHSDFAVVPPQMPWAQARSLLQSTGMGCVLVCDEGQLVGLLSDRDAGDASEVDAQENASVG